MPPKPLKRIEPAHSGKIEPNLPRSNLAVENLKLRLVLPSEGFTIKAGVKVFAIENSSYPYRFRIEFWNGSEFKGSRMVYDKKQALKILSGEMK